MQKRLIEHRANVFFSGMQQSQPIAYRYTMDLETIVTSLTCRYNILTNFLSYNKLLSFNDVYDYQL